jgi:diguanylate cyclase (GGDEF)-like protein
MANTLLATKKEILRQSEIFSSLQTHELQVIARNSEYLKLNPGDKIFSEGDPGEALYIVHFGEIIVQKQEEYGPLVDIARFIKGNCFGDLDLFTDSSRAASALTSDHSGLLVFPRKGTSFAEFLQKHPHISAHILHKILVNIAGRIRRANSLIKENSPLMQELKKQVYRDKLTGIFNQTFLIEELRKLVVHREEFTLIITKPDNFKDLNDSFGHEAGDQVIKILARRLREFIGDDERVVRYKGNAMAVILHSSSRTKAKEEGIRIRDFINHLDLKKVTKGKSFQMSASVGISLCPEHGIDPETLIFNTHELPLLGRQRGGNLILFPEDAGEGQ